MRLINILHFLVTEMMKAGYFDNGGWKFQWQNERYLVVQREQEEQLTRYSKDSLISSGIHIAWKF